MASGRLLLPQWMPALDSDGAPIPNAKVYFYENGTTTLASVFADEALTVLLTNPVEANASGRFPAIWASDAVTYSASVDASYGPAGVPRTYDNLSVSIGADILIAGAAEAAADEAEQHLADVEAAIQAAQDADGVAAVAGALAGQAAGTAAAEAVVAGKLDVNALNIKTNGPTLRKNIQVVRAITPEGYASASEAATTALSLDIPVRVDSGTATIDLDVQGYSADPEVRWSYFQTVCKWAAKNSVTTNGRIRLRLVPGPHEMTVNRDSSGIAVIRRAQANSVLDLDAQANQSSVVITGIAIGARSGNNYTLTVTVATAIPAGQLVGAPVGLSNIKGDNDAEALSGCGIIKSIAGDRLSFTCDIVNPRTADLVAPTTINSAATDYSWPSSRAVFWDAWLSFDTSASTAPPGWNGVTDSEEGVFQIYGGGSMVGRRLGIVWRGSFGAEYHQDLFFGRSDPGGGAQINLAACGIVGAPENLFRLYGANANLQLDQCHLGGGAKSEKAVMTQNGAQADIVQSVAGGFRGDVMQAGTVGSIRNSGCIIAGGEYGVRVIGNGSSGTTLNCRLVGNKNAVYADQGATFQVSNGSFTTYISRNTVGITRLAGSQVNGDVTFSGNTTDSNAVANLLDGGGLWRKDATGLSIALGGGTAITKALKVSVSFNVASVPAASVSKQTVTVTGAAEGDFLVVDTAFDLPVGLALGQSRVSAANTVTLNYINPTAGAVDQGSITYNFLLIRTG